MHYVHDIFRVIFLQKLQNFKLDTSLIHIFLLIFNYFQRYFCSILMINAFECCAKWSFTQEFENFIPIPDMVILNVFIVALIVIVSKIKL